MPRKRKSARYSSAKARHACAVKLGRQRARTAKRDKRGRFK